MSEEILSDGDLMLLGIVRNCATVAKKRIDDDGKRAIGVTLTWLDAFLIRGEEKDRERLRLAVNELVKAAGNRPENMIYPIWSVIFGCWYFISPNLRTHNQFYDQFDIMRRSGIFGYQKSQTMPSQQS